MREAQQFGAWRAFADWLLCLLGIFFASAVAIAALFALITFMMWLMGAMRTTL